MLFLVLNIDTIFIKFIYILTAIIYRHRDHEISRRDHEGSSRGHDSRHYEGRSHGGHEGRSHSGHEERLHGHDAQGRPQSNERRSYSHESRSHSGHDQDREDINRHQHQNNSG